nr:MAG TPA: hypothetical protein [Caudoviricetes sp.]
MSSPSCRVRIPDELPGFSLSRSSTYGGAPQPALSNTAHPERHANAGTMSLSPAE